MTMPATTAVTTIRGAEPSDLQELLRLEALCFRTDRLSRRSFRRWLRHDDCVFLVCSTDAGELCGYILVILRRGTRLARLYSLAVDPSFRGRGLAGELTRQAELDSRAAGALYMRLEVATDNVAGIALYRKAGYRPFGLYHDYYDDHGDAVRMEKCIHAYKPAGTERVIPWIAQSTGFTCGPASLMMAMAALDDRYAPSPAEEIRIWREATTIFMTSGHGGCHPIGLALSAVRRGFDAEVWINQRGPLFLESVRDANKKRVLRLVHETFVEEARARHIPVHYTPVDQQQLVDSFNAGANVLVLISTYRLDRKKAPHWVVLSGVDESCLYVQDPDLSTEGGSDIAGEARNAMDCQHLPIAREDFTAMTRFGGNRLQTAVILRRGGATAGKLSPGSPSP
jgi:ribosomal protein S18 acetylase RimI-like enzyme